MKKISILMVIMAALISKSIFADESLNLTFSDAEKQKLNHYFPVSNAAKILWQGDPIRIYLPVDQEKRLIFDNHVTVDMKGALNTDQLKVLNNDKSIYLTALKNFPNTRMYVTDQLSNKVILIDLIVSQEANNNAQQISFFAPEKADAGQGVVTSENTENNENTTRQVFDGLGSQNNISSSVDLIRYAWKETYAAKVTLNSLPAYPRAPMQTKRFVSGLVYGDKVIAHPATSWLIEGSYVTVVFIQNKYAHSTTIDVAQDLCGAWQAATLYPTHILAKRGNKNADSATLFLVSKHSFGETLEECESHA